MSRNAATRNLAFVLGLALTFGYAPARADVKLPCIFGSHMVLQRDQKDKVWGWAEPGEEVTVTIAGPDQDRQGRRRRQLVGHARPDARRRAAHDDRQGQEHAHASTTCSSARSGSARASRTCSCRVGAANDADLETLAAEYPRDPADLRAAGRHAGAAGRTSRASGRRCTPETVGDFSAVGYFFGRQLHQTLDVPIGLIDDSWGGSAARPGSAATC